MPRRSTMAEEKLIPLTKGYFTRVDSADFTSLSQHKWQVMLCRRKAYARRSICQNGVTTHIYMHREITGATTEKVDHRDNNGLNNTRGNLRFATPTQNNINCPKFKGNSSRYKGVCFNRQRNKWVAAIRLNVRSVYLGGFKEECDAALAYNFAVYEAHGEFAWMNAPLDAAMQPQ